MRLALYIATLLVFVGTAGKDARTTTHNGLREACSLDQALEAAWTHVSSPEFSGILDSLSGQGPKLGLIAGGKTNFQDRLIVRFDLELDATPVSGAGIVVTVERDCRASAVIIEPERIAAVASFRAARGAESVNPNPKPNESSIKLTNDLAYPSAPIRSDGPLLDASGERVRLVDRLTTSDGRVFVVDRDKQLLVLTKESDGHGASHVTGDRSASSVQGQVQTQLMSSRPPPAGSFASSTEDSFVTGQGLAYWTDPGSGEAVLQPINRLRNDGSRLDGKFVRSISSTFDTDGLATETSGEPRTFIFEPITDGVWECANDPQQCSRFDNVNAYVHIDRFAEDYWQARLGIEVDWQTTVLTHTPLGGSVVHGDTILLGTGDLFLQNNALEDDIIYHEYVHVLLRHVGFSTDIYSTTQRRAVGEGYADYFSLSYSGHPEFANWATTCPPRFECEGPENSTELRTLASDAAEWNWNYGSPSIKLQYGLCVRKHLEDMKCKTSYNTYTNTYVWGMIWGSTLWDIRSALGRDDADRLIASSLTLTGGTIFTFTTAAGAILYADKQVFGGAHEETLRAIFADRGITPFISVGMENELDIVLDPATLTIDAFPNPFAESITLELYSPQPTHARARLFDISGRELLSTDLGMIPSGRSQTSVAVPRLADGFYLLQVATDYEVVTRTVVRAPRK